MGQKVPSCLNCFPSLQLPISNISDPVPDINLSATVPEPEKPLNCMPIELSILSACETEFLLLKSKKISEDSSLILDKSGYLIYGQDYASGFLLKSEFKVPVSSSLFLKYLQDTELRPKWDKNVEFSQSKQILNDVSLTYTRFKRILGVSQRDLVIISKEFEADQGKLLVSTSYTCKEFPEIDGITRIKIELAGYFLKDGDTGETSVFCITQANFGGIMPHRAMKLAVAGTIPKFHNELVETIQKFEGSHS